MITAPISKFVAHFLQASYKHFDTILKDKLSLVQILEARKFAGNIALYPIDVKSLYTNTWRQIPNTKATIEYLKAESKCCCNQNPITEARIQMLQSESNIWRQNSNAVARIQLLKPESKC